jgi:hypothetical protein
VFRLFKKVWIPLLLVVVVALGSYVVLRVRASFGATANASGHDANADNTKPFNPKHITYEITAPSGGRVSVNYLDQDGQPHLVENAPLPWSYTIVTPACATSDAGSSSTAKSATTAPSTNTNPSSTAW